MADKRKRRLNLHAKDPRCTFCGVETVIIPHENHGKRPENEANLYHDKANLTTVLACRACITKKTHEEHQALGIEELRLRSSPQGMCTCACGNRHIKSMKAPPTTKGETTNL